MCLLFKFCRKFTSSLVWGDKIPDSKRFKLVLDNEAVLDKETGLLWERAPDHTITRNWQDAVQYC